MVQGLHLAGVWSAIVRCPRQEAKVLLVVIALVVVNVVALKMLHSLNWVESGAHKSMDIGASSPPHIYVVIARLLVQVRLKFITIFGEYLAI